MNILDHMLMHLVKLFKNYLDHMLMRLEKQLNQIGKELVLICYLTAFIYSEEPILQLKNSNNGKKLNLLQNKMINILKYAFQASQARRRTFRLLICSQETTWLMEKYPSFLSFLLRKIFVPMVFIWMINDIVTLLTKKRFFYQKDMQFYHSAALKLIIKCKNTKRRQISRIQTKRKWIRFMKKSFI